MHATMPIVSGRPPAVFATLQRLPEPFMPEAQALAAARAALEAGAFDAAAAQGLATPWVQALRDQPPPFWALESLLQEYPISSPEGLALMRLAEALLRIPDAETAIALAADQLGRADFGGQNLEAHQAAQSSSHPVELWAALSASVLALAAKLLPEPDQPSGLLARWGARGVLAATLRAIQLLGQQFVLGRDINEALAKAGQQRQAQPGLRFSFDMLGEGARNEADAQRYHQAYLQALQALIAAQSHAGGPLQGEHKPELGDGLSIKLSALFSRYEPAQAERVFAELMPRLWALVELAAPAGLNLTIDAEESDRLELSLALLEALAQRVAAQFPGWRGLGLAVQAYQTRALATVAEVLRVAQAHRLRLMVRLVKGAYRDGEIKRAQELGLAAYPVFTRKAHTDVSYLACAQALLAARAWLYPQFAGHNAGTIAGVLQLAQAAGARPGIDFELQRLHGMGEGLFRQLLAGAAKGSQPGSGAVGGAAGGAVAGALSGLACRIYAPVGPHRELLAYLVRRLLENGANSSFVHQLADPKLPLAELLASPLRLAHPGTADAGPVEGLPLPAALYGPGRRAAAGLDLAYASQRAPIAAALAALPLAPALPAEPADAPAQVDQAMQALAAAFPAWSATPLAERAAVLRRAADLLEARGPATIALLVREASKTWGDAVAEWREAIDFCRYYAQQAEATLAPQILPGPTGERNELRLRGRGVFVCISPWNFPLAIFAGQVLAALVAGNTVAAKPAEQTPAVAAAFVALLHEAGLPATALRLLPGLGETVGAALVAHRLVAGVCFTGSTAVAKRIQRALAAGEGPIVPLIAETGGLNAMLVDSSALPEQVVDAVVQSAFRSAGQRCSALRLLCLHEAIADPVLAMLAGAMAELRLGDPADWATDVGPLIDDAAFARVSAEVARLRREVAWVAEAPLPNGLAGRPALPCLLAPVVFELPSLAALRRAGAAQAPAEIFGPVLQVLRWGPRQRHPQAARSAAELIGQINALGYGLTLGLQTRIEQRAQRWAEQARVGNVYVNRNTIGAVVGVQPFGGEGLSGTGPKAGGPHYLLRFCSEQTLTINTAAAGGNAELLAGRIGHANGLSAV